MPFKAPLTHSDLRAIRERQPWNEDVLALLWEIKRIRSMVLRLHQVSCDLKRPAGQAGELYDELLTSVAAEPCVLERDQDVQALMEAPHKLRKGMAPR